MLPRHEILRSAYYGPDVYYTREHDFDYRSLDSFVHNRFCHLWLYKGVEQRIEGF